MEKKGSPVDEVAHTDDSHGKRDLIAYAILAAVLLAVAYLYYVKAI